MMTSSMLLIFNLFLIALITVSTALPTTLLEDTKALNLRPAKVKRTPEGVASHTSQIDGANLGQSPEYYNNPSAKKRDNVNIPRWENVATTEALLRRQQQLRPDLFTDDDAEENLDLEDKSLSEYAKAYHYGSNKAKLDEQLENAVLKGEIYDPSSPLSQFRYYSRDDRRRKRSDDSSKKRHMTRIKREMDLSPEDVLALLSLWETEKSQHHRPLYGHNRWPQHFSGENLEFDDEGESNEILSENGNAEEGENDENGDNELDETWLENPVINPNSHRYNVGQYPLYYYNSYEPNEFHQPLMAKRNWSFGRSRPSTFGNRAKRFMVARKRSGRFLDNEPGFYGTPAQHDDNIYTLAQLLGGSQQRDPNVPLYRRLML